MYPAALQPGKTAVLLSVCFLFAASTVLAAEKVDASAFLHSFANALGWVHEANLVIDASTEKKGTTAERDVEVAYANLKARDYFERAAAELEPYQNGETFAALSAGAAVRCFREYQKEIDDWTQLTKDMNTALRSAEEGKEHPDPSVFTDRMAQFRFRGDKTGEALVQSAVGATWAAFEYGDDGKPLYPMKFAISRKDRLDVISELTRAFGTKIKNGPKTELSWAENAAAVICSTLAKPFKESGKK